MVLEDEGLHATCQCWHVYFGFYQVTDEFVAKCCRVLLDARPLTLTTKDIGRIFSLLTLSPPLTESLCFPWFYYYTAIWNIF